jgi:hypothetical protein
MLAPKEAIGLIIKSGGIPILAHPGKLLSELDNFDSSLGRLMTDGLRGIEVYYSLHSEKEIRELKKIAANYGLLITGGSDWHGYNYPPSVKIGSELSKDEFNKFYKSILK